MKIDKIKKAFNGASADSFFLIIVRIVTIALGIFITRVLSDHFSLNEYGTYSQIILLVSTISNFTILGMTDGINYFFCREQDTSKRNSYISTIFLLQGVISAFTSITVLVCAIPISNYFQNGDIKGLIAFAAFLPFTQNMINMLQVMFIALGKAKHIAARNFLISLFKLVSMLFACYLFDNIAVVLVFQLITDAIQICYFAISLWKNGAKILFSSFDKSLIKEILTYCIPMGMFVVMKNLNKDCDKYVIAAFTNTEALAVYTNASKHLPFDIIMTSFCTVLFPYITRYIASRDFVTLRKVYKSFLELSYTSTGILAVAAMCVAPELISFLYTDKYIDGLDVFILYLFVEIISVLSLTIILSASRKMKTIAFISIGTFIVNLGLNILFYELFGFVGPAIATVIVTLLQGITILAISSREIQTNIFDMFSKRYALLFVAEAICIGVLTCGLRFLLLQLGVPSFFILLICCSLYVVVMLALNYRRLKKNLGIINSCKMESKQDV